MPDKGVRRDVFQCLAQNLSTGGSSVPIQDAGQEYGATGKAMALDFVTLSSMTEGYSHSDMRDLMDNAMQQSFIRNSKVDERVSDDRKAWPDEVDGSHHGRLRAGTSIFHTQRTARSVTAKIRYELVRYRR